MNKFDARKLASVYHRFTRVELHNILKEALEKLPESYWKKPNKVNKIFDNGYYFNACVKWVDYIEGVNDNEFCSIPITVRVLEVFGQFSKVQLPKEIKPKIDIVASQKPSLNN